MYTAGVEEVVCPAARRERPGDRIARHVGNHVEEREHPFAIREDPTPAVDLVNAASAQLEAEIKRLTEAVRIGRIDCVVCGESAVLAAQRTDKGLPTAFSVMIVVSQLLASEALHEDA